MQISTSIGYKDIFDDYENVEIDYLLNGIPTKNSLEIICHFLAQLHTVERNPSRQIEFLKIWLGRLPTFIYGRINDFVKKVGNFQNADYNFLNNVSALKLIESVLENENSLPPVENLTAEQELNLFKAYLWCTQQWIDIQGSTFKGEKITNEEEFIQILVPSQLPFQELLEFKDFRIQFIKAIFFFKFCEKNEHFKGFLTFFLKEYNLKSWQTYLVHLLNLYIPKFDNPTRPSIINITDEFEDLGNFIHELCIDTTNFTKAIDFLPIREKPVYKIGDKQFLFLNFNFLIDKIFQGIQFDFARVLIKNNVLYKGSQIKKFVDFKNIYGEEFSENGLFYEIMEYSFNRSSYIRLKGEEIKAIIKSGEPDYYIRDKSKVYLFEFKDVLLNASIKNSYDYTKIKEETFKKLVKNQKDAPKGVTQLVDVIEKIRNSKFQNVDNFNFENAIIYPVVVFTDYSFNLPGFNLILNVEFRKQLKERAIRKTEFIKNLILIDLDTLVKFQDLFQNKTLKLNNCFNDYLEHLGKSRNIINRTETFNTFIHNKTKKMNYESPKMLMEELRDILPKE